MKSSVKNNSLEILLLPTVSFTVPKLQKIYNECFITIKASSVSNTKKINECLKQLQAKVLKDPLLEDVYRPAIEECQNQLNNDVKPNFLEVYKQLIDYVSSYYYEVDKGNYYFFLM